MRYLIQANLLAAWTSRSWDRFWLLGNESLLGQSARILGGYDARPSGMPLTFYAMTLLSLSLGSRWNRWAAARSAPRVAGDVADVESRPVGAQPGNPAAVAYMRNTP